jgi:CHRD domain
MLASASSRSLSKLEMSGVFHRLRTASLVICTVAATSFAAPLTAEAASLIFGTVLGNFENPPTGSAGTGSALVTLNTDVPQMMTVNVSFSGLGSPTTVAHIHCCIASPGNAIVATTTPTFPGFPGMPPPGVTFGTYNMTFDMTLASSYNPAFITAHGGTVSGALAALFAGITAGEAYLNIHTSQFMSGEIRGFLAPVPLPNALPLFATGLAALGLLGLRRKRKAA